MEIERQVIFMKKLVRLMTVVTISVALTACGSGETANSSTDMGISIQTEKTVPVETEEIPPVETEEIPPAETEEIPPAETEQKTEGVYEDNFAVEAGDAKAFAEKIQAAVAAKDIEALADLTAFPVYVGIVGGVEDREAFIALGADTVFTTGLMESVEGADVSNLSPSMAGFSISKEGKENIIFGVVEGRLAISGINYE